MTSIALQLACSIPGIEEYICNAISERKDIANQSLRDQWHQLIIRPLSELKSNNSYPSSYLFIVDALDECDSENDIRMILQLLTEARMLKTVQLRVFLTSRPEGPIRQGFYYTPHGEYKDFVLHSIAPNIVDHDISIFVEYNMGAIKQERCLEAGWPGPEASRCLVRNSNGLFIWAATACRFIREGKKRQIIESRLSSVLRSTGSINEPGRHLNEIYMTVLRHSIPPQFSDEERQEFCSKLRNILGCLVVLLSPLSIHSLSTVLCISEKDVDETLEDLHAILNIPKDHIHPLYLHHPSFRDVLLSNDRCTDLNFWVDKKESHQMLANSCIQLMSSSLKQNICGLNTPGMLVTDVERSRIEQYLPPDVQYACVYWIQHLQKSGAQLHDNDRVHQFLEVHLLHWLEALGWIGKTSEGIRAMFSLDTQIQVRHFYKAVLERYLGLYILRLITTLAYMRLSVMQSNLSYTTNGYLHKLLSNYIIRHLSLPQRIALLKDSSEIIFQRESK